MSESFKKTEVGHIPADWICRPIGEIACVGRGRVISHREISRALSPTYPVYSSQTSNNGVMGYLDTYDFEGDYVTWTTDGVNAGTVFYRSGKFNCTNVCGTIKPIQHNTSYVALALSQRTGRYVSRNLANPKLMNDVMKQIAIALPPSVDEQYEIANAITEFDELIVTLEQLISKKRDIQQATMQQLLTGQLRLPGFSGEWKDGELRDVVRSLEAGVSVNSSDDLPEPGLPCVLKTSALSSGNFYPNEAKAIVAADRGRACTNPKRNTILISRMNTPALVGEIAYVGKDYDWLFLPDRLWMTRFMSDDCVNARWLAYLLSSRPYRGLLQDSATGTSGSMKNISKGVLLSLQISYPAIEEQTAIATILSDMDSELAALESRRDKARQLKQGMMQELLTGRIRLV